MITCEKLEIALFRVSPDSKYLDIMLECPEPYYMSSFELLVAHWINDGGKDKLQEDRYDFSSALQLNENKPDKWRIRVSLQELGINYPAMYYATFKAKHQHIERTIVDEAVASDVNYVYQCVLKDVIEKCSPCKKEILPDDTILNYLILYGHQAAMFLRDFYTAENYFKILSRCFQNCGCAKSACSCQKTDPCGCDHGCKNVVTIVDANDKPANTTILPEYTAHTTATTDQIANLNFD